MHKFGNKSILLELLICGTYVITAIALGLPLLNPYKMTDADFRHGVNFAVAGSTALPVEFLTKKNISSPATNSSLSVQLDWMLTHFDSLCHGKRGTGWLNHIKQLVNLNFRD